MSSKEETINLQRRRKMRLRSGCARRRRSTTPISGEWSITEMLAWIIWREIDAVRNECDDYRRECADKPSGWGELRLRACLKNISPQAAIEELWKTAGEGRIKATALRYENAKAIDGDPIDIPARLLAAFETHRRSVDRKGDVDPTTRAGSTERFSFPIGRQKTLAKVTAVVRRTCGDVAFPPRADSTDRVHDVERPLLLTVRQRRLASITLFIGTVAIWAQLIPQF